MAMHWFVFDYVFLLLTVMQTTAGYDNTVCIWNTLKGTQNRLSMHGGAVRALAANDR